MNFILFDDNRFEDFLPLTYTRPVSELRCGILTIKEKWEKYLNTHVSYYSRPHLNKKYTLKVGAQNTIINSGCFPNDVLVAAILKLEPKQALYNENTLIAFRLDDVTADTLSNYESAIEAKQEYNSDLLQLSYLWDIFSKNDKAIRADFEMLTKGRNSAPLPSHNTLIGDKKDLFIEEGAIVNASILNVCTGPIYIGKDAEIMEGSVVRGPLAMGEHSVLKLATKIYGATTIGPGCKVGGEVNNSVFHSNSNKAHDGFIGNAVIGEWCNLGADTNNSNLKNNYEEVKLWNEHKGTFVKTGLQFCGLIMGDHSKCGINTMFNTGTVVGVSCNIYGAGFPRNFVPSYSWGSSSGFMEYQFNKAVDTAQRVFARRGIEMDEVEKDILKYVYEQTESQRKY